MADVSVTPLPAGLPVDEEVVRHIQEYILDPAKTGEITGIFYVVTYNNGCTGHGNVMNKASKYLPYSVLGCWETLKYKLLRDQ